MSNEKRKAYKYLASTAVIIAAGVAVTGICAYQSATPKSEADWWNATIGHVPGKANDVHVYDSYLKDNLLFLFFAGIRANTYGTAPSIGGMIMDENDKAIKYTTDEFGQIKEGRIAFDHDGMKVDACWAISRMAEMLWTLDFKKNNARISMEFLKGSNGYMRPNALSVWQKDEAEFTGKMRTALDSFKDQLRAQEPVMRYPIFMAPCSIIKNDSGVSFNIIFNSDGSNIGASGGGGSVKLCYETKKVKDGTIHLYLKDSQCNGDSVALRFWEEANKTKQAYRGTDFNHAMSNASASILSQVNDYNFRFRISPAVMQPSR